MKFHIRITLVVIIVVASTFNSFCQQQKAVVSADSIPEKLQAYRQAFLENLPQPTGYVNDYENLYTDSEEHVLTGLINDFEKKTSVQIAVVSFDTSMTTSDSLEALTLRFARLWGVGQKNKDNGVVIGICRGYRKMRIETGTGMVNILTSREAKAIIDNSFIPDFKNGNYFAGTLAGIKALMMAINRNSAPN